MLVFRLNEVVKTCPRPTDLEDVQSFMRVSKVSWNVHVRIVLSLSTQLTKFIQKKVKFQRTINYEQRFHGLRDILISTPVFALWKDLEGNAIYIACHKVAIRSLIIEIFRLKFKTCEHNSYNLANNIIASKKFFESIRRWMFLTRGECERSNFFHIIKHKMTWVYEMYVTWSIKLRE